MLTYGYQILTKPASHPRCKPIFYISSLDQRLLRIVYLLAYYFYSTILMWVDYFAWI
jgi:hypothetical protein